MSKVAKEPSAPDTDANDGFEIDDPELERELLLSIAEADAGDTIPAEEVLRHLRRRSK